MKQNLAETFERDRRLAALRLLAEAPGYSCNTSVLHQALETLGHHMSRDSVRALAAWLEEQGLVRAEDLGNSVVVLTLAERGGDVAAGRAQHPGVRRPSPRPA